MDVNVAAGWFSSDPPAELLFLLRHRLQSLSRGADTGSQQPGDTARKRTEIFEIGSKFLLMGGALTFKGALFTIEKTNAVPRSDPRVQVLDGKQRSRGREFSAADGSVRLERFRRLHFSTRRFSSPRTFRLSKE